MLWLLVAGLLLLLLFTPIGFWRLDQAKDDPEWARVEGAPEETAEA